MLLTSNEAQLKVQRIYKSVMNHLTLLESFAKGLEYEVYDFKTFVYLTPNELFEILNSLKQFNHALLEKPLHVKFHENGGTAAFGLSVWSKFIAQCIANYVMNEKPHNVFFPKQEQLIHLLYEALPGLDTSNTAHAQKGKEYFLEGYKLNQYALGHYCAMFLTNPIVVCMFEYELQANRSLEECTEDEVSCLDDILDYLCNKLDKDDFWIVDVQWLTGLGLLVNELWDCRILHRK